MSKQTAVLVDTKGFIEAVNKYNEQSHVFHAVETINGDSLTTLFAMYRHLEKLFEYFNHEVIEQLLETLNVDLFGPFDEVSEEAISISAMYGHNRLFHMQHLIVSMLKLKNDVIRFDRQAKSDKIIHTF